MASTQAWQLFYNNSLYTPTSSSGRWMVGSAGEVYFINAAGEYIQHSITSSPIISISGAADGSAVAIDNLNNLYVYDINLGTWELVVFIMGQVKSAASAGGSDFAYITLGDTKHKIHNNVITDLGDLEGPTDQITTTMGFTEIWGLKENAAFKWINGGWAAVNGKSFRHINVSFASLSAPQTLYVIGTDTAGRAWRLMGAIWIGLPIYTADTFLSVEGCNGYLWGLTANTKMVTLQV